VAAACMLIRCILVQVTALSNGKLHFPMKFVVFFPATLHFANENTTLSMKIVLISRYIYLSLSS
jgi:hypothetical protein